MLIKNLKFKMNNKTNNNNKRKEVNMSMDPILSFLCWFASHISKWKNPKEPI